MSVTELRDAFERNLSSKLRDLAMSPDDVVSLRVDRWVDLVTSSFRELGKASGLEIAPIRRGVGELGWELVWGKNLMPGYEKLGSVAPADLFRLDLVLELSEGSLRPGVRPEGAVEEVCFDLARLLWSRARTKVLVFGAHRETELASSIDAFEAGLTGLIEARDKEADYLLVALPNLEGARTVSGDRATLWTKVVSGGKGQPARSSTLELLLRG
jgi:hypothetical protein